MTGFLAVTSADHTFSFWQFSSMGQNTWGFRMSASLTVIGVCGHMPP